MRTFAADNLLFLREHYPAIYQTVRNRERNVNRYRLTPSKSGEANLELADEAGGKTTPVYSRYSPRLEAERWVETVAGQIGEAKHVLMYGFGLGYHLEAFIQHFPDRILHFFEPDIEMFLAAIEARDLSGILKHGNIGIIGVGNDDLILHQFLDALTLYIADSFSSLFVPFYAREYKREADHFTQLFRQRVLTFRTNAATRVLFKEEWPENIILNSPRLLHGRSLSGTEGAFRDVPAIVVGSGPSLDLDIDGLRKLQDRAIIIAAGTSVQALLAKDIRPHVVVTIDGSEKNYRAFHDLELDGIPLVFASFVHRKIVERDREDLYHIFIKEDTISTHLFESTRLPINFHSTSTVTGTAIQLANLFGCRTVILVGQDLSYPDGHIYAKGVDHFTDEELRLTRRLTEQVPNVNGGWNPTSKSMKNMLENVEHVIAYYGSTIDFINTSRCGAAIKGTRHVTFDRLEEEVRFAEIPPETFRAVLRERTKPYDQQERERVIRLTADWKRQLEELLNRELKDLQGRFYDLREALAAKDEKQVERNLFEINDLWNKITRHPIFDPVFGFVLQGEIPIYTRRIPEIVRCNQVIKKGELVFEHLGRLVGIMLHDARRLTELFETALRDMLQDSPMAGVTNV